MDQYRIHFDLLIPRWFLLRLDVLPFLFLYSLLAGGFYHLDDSGNTYIYLRLTVIAIGFMNCLTYIFGHWSKKIQAKIQYRVIKGPVGNNLLKASHVFIQQKVPGTAWQYGISDLYLQELESTKEQIFFFMFQQRKFYFSNSANKFIRLKPELEGCPINEIIHRAYNTEMYDDNILEIPIRPFSDIFKDQIVDPFQFFQLFSVLLWTMDQNAGYSLFLLGMLIFSAYMIASQRIKTLVGYRSMTLAPHEVMTFRAGKWTPISSYDLKPGDLVIVTAGYEHHRLPHEMMSDEDYLKSVLPFGAGLPSRMQAPQKKEDNTSYRTMPCDVLLLSGTCVANESILTGEAIPQIKQSISEDILGEKFSNNYHKHNILFCGTEVLQVNDHLHPTELKGLQLNPASLENLPKKGCLGVVLSTGFDTSKGKLLRRVIANAENLKLEEKDGLWIVLFLLICSLITSAYVLDQGMENQQRSKQKLFLRCILIITTVVPPELPMIMTLTVNNSILSLQKKKIFISEPKKIPIGGKISTVAFDKTGTLTEDKFIFEGIVDDCKQFKDIKKFTNCQHENLVVLAGCHSLISIDKELSGDPIELMFFNDTRWEYTSKSKEARRGIQRVKINKVYPFRSELKRMSTVVEHTPENGHLVRKALVKGAPEAIEKLLSVVPADYEKAYKFYTKQGYRLLALASKTIDINESQYEQREKVQSNLNFCGFFICSSPLKEDTLKNIKSLQKAKFNILIITGDNILTAIKVGLTLSMGERPYIVECTDGKVQLQTEDGVKVQVKSPQEMMQKVNDPEALICTSTAKDLSPEYYPYITIFARTSPHDKEVIVKKVKEITGCGILYAGDGTNDMGGLRAADVGVAVIGTTSISETEKKEEELKKEQESYKRKIKDLQNDVVMPFRQKLTQMQNLTKEYQMKKKGNMFSFLEDDEAKAGDACFAAPFTSKHSNSIKCVLIIIRQSIAVLVTTIQTYKILAISSMIQAYSLAEMNLTNLKYSQSQTTVIGILASINLYYFSNAQPLKRISHIRAPHTIFNIWFAISFFGQMAIFVFCNYYALNQIGLKYLPQEDKAVSADLEFKKSFLNTVIFLFSVISQSTVFIANHGGEPHMQSLLKNSRELKFLIIPLVVCFVMTANLSEDLSSMFDLKFENVPYEANLEMLTVFGLMVGSTYMLERLCRFGQYKEFVGWF